MSTLFTPGFFDRTGVSTVRNHCVGPDLGSGDLREGPETIGRTVSCLVWLRFVLV